MESLPKKEEQMSFEFKDKVESIKAGDVLKYVAVDKDYGYFVNQSGLKIDTLPLGAKIKTAPRTVALGVEGMQECEGEIFFKDGKTLFLRDLNVAGIKGFYEPAPSKFLDGDEVEIVELK